MMSTAEIVQDPAVTSSQQQSKKSPENTAVNAVNEAIIKPQTLENSEHAKPTELNSNEVTSSTLTKPETNVPGTDKPVSTAPTNKTNALPPKGEDKTLTSQKDKIVNSDEKEKEKPKGPITFDKETFVEAPLPAKNPWKKPEPPKPPTPAVVDKKPDSESQQHDKAHSKRPTGPASHRGAPPRSPRSGGKYPRSGPSSGRPDHRRFDDKGRRPGGPHKPQSSNSSQSQQGETVESIMVIGSYAYYHRYRCSISMLITFMVIRFISIY